MRAAREAGAGVRSEGRKRRCSPKLSTRLLVGVVAVALALVSCGDSRAEREEERARADAAGVVTTTFTILADFASAVAGDRMEVRTLTPVGAEVHEHELRPRDFVNIEEADIVLYNGYMIEQWMPQVRQVARDEVELHAVAELTGADTIPIRLGEFEGDPDPHLWMDPAIAIRYVEVIRDIVVEIDPEGSETYERNSAAYIEELERLKVDLEERLAVIAEDQRVLITSEAAFLYFAEAFGFVHDGVWGTNHEDEGTPEQLARVVDIVTERRPGAIFYESTISDRHIRSVSDDTGVPVAGPLYVDSVSDPDGEAPTYLEMMRLNAERIVDALGE